MSAGKHPSAPSTPADEPERTLWGQRRPSHKPGEDPGTLSDEDYVWTGGPDAVDAAASIPASEAEAEDADESAQPAPGQ